LDELIANAKDRGQLTKWQEGRIERLYNVVSGAVNGVESQRLANASAFIRSWLVSAQLGSAPISAFSDVVTGAMARQANGMPLTRGLRIYSPGYRGLKPRAWRLPPIARCYSYSRTGLATLQDRPRAPERQLTSLFEPAV
jgi:hypothetical protein